jgi:hypothetical protein
MSTTATTDFRLRVLQPSGPRLILDLGQVATGLPPWTPHHLPRRARRHVCRVRARHRREHRPEGGGEPAADISFVLDRLTGPRPGWKGGGLIDTSRIAMAGAPVGGASAAGTAAGTMVKDARVRAGITLDGNA